MEELGTIKDRLVQFIKAMGLSQSRFEKRCGMSNGYVNNLRTAIGPDKLANIAHEFPDLNIGWLVIGEKYGGPMFKTPVEKESNNEAPRPEIDSHSNSLPLIPIEAFAGPGEFNYEDERIENYYTVTDFKDSDFLLRVKGDSMIPKYNGGDLVACRRVSDVYYLQWGRVYCIYTRSQGAMIKRIQPSEKDGWIRCVSENTKYAPFDVPMDDVESIALVNGSISLE